MAFQTLCVHSILESSFLKCLETVTIVERLTTAQKAHAGQIVLAIQQYVAHYVKNHTHLGMNHTHFAKIPTLALDNTNLWKNITRRTS